jgi:hypothetical protein
MREKQCREESMCVCVPPITESQTKQRSASDDLNCPGGVWSACPPQANTGEWGTGKGGSRAVTYLLVVGARVSIIGVCRRD